MSKGVIPNHRFYFSIVEFDLLVYNRNIQNRDEDLVNYSSMHNDLCVFVQKERPSQHLTLDSLHPPNVPRSKQSICHIIKYKRFIYVK